MQDAARKRKILAPKNAATSYGGKERQKDSQFDVL